MFAPTLVHEYLTRSADRYPEKTALVFGDERLSYGSLDRYSERLAQELSKMGIRRHDRVVVFMDNPLAATVSLFGILKAGAVFVILGGTMKAKKLAYILRDSGAAAVVTHDNKKVEVTGAVVMLANPPRLIRLGDSIVPETPSTEDGEWERPRCIDQDLAALIYTSGSTGEPKGVVSSHHNMVSAARSIIRYLGNTTEDVIVNVLPLSFDYGLYQVIMSVMFGGTVVFESFMFPVKVIQRIEKERATGLPLVPTVAAFLLKMSTIDAYDLSSLRYMTNTGAALPVDHIRRLRRLFPGVRIFSMFGLTECKRVCYLPPEEIDRRPGSVGKAIPDCEVFVLDENGREVAPGDVGELVIRGSNVMRGYWNAPDLTARAYRPGSIQGETWLYSGDYFRMDEEGFLYFLGRKDDMIKTKGERVSPKEVENVLTEIPGVAEAAVIGVPDEILGNAVKAFLVRIPGTFLDERDVMRYCSKHLENFMMPKYIEFVEDLPKSPHGKVDKSKLKKDGAIQ